jgi:uncharacterized protein involved in response to NO
MDAAWHGHEMVFGFAGAAISGFLMAAVPKWTNRPPITGHRLMFLIGLYRAGRIGMATGGPLAWADIAFLPALAAFKLADIHAARNRRNYQVPAMLFVLTGLNVAWHLGYTQALWAGVYLIGGLIALIGGRIVPAFTESGLRMTGLRVTASTPAWLDTLAVPMVLAVVATEVVAPLSMASGIAALAAGAVLLARMAGWQTLRTAKVPLVWILHAGYIWVPAGFLLKAASDLGGWVTPTVALHALTAGAIGIMILAVASRAALGHSGRPLVPSRWTVLSYGLVIAAALLRVAFPYGTGILVSGLLWTLGWLVFSIVYWPILTKPRIDGLPG